MPKKAGAPPSIDRLFHVVFEGEMLPEEMVRQYRAAFRRPPDTTESPEKSNTPWWWVGYVTRKERDEFNKGRQIRFDYLTMQVFPKRGRRKKVEGES